MGALLVFRALIAACQACLVTFPSPSRWGPPTYVSALVWWLRFVLLAADVPIIADSVAEHRCICACRCASGRVFSESGATLRSSNLLQYCNIATLQYCNIATLQLQHCNNPVIAIPRYACACTWTRVHVKPAPAAVRRRHAVHRVHANARQSPLSQQGQHRPLPRGNRGRHGHHHADSSGHRTSCP
jgi:hypothetical protein